MKMFNKQRHVLLTGTRMTPMERKAGRFLRAPEHDSSTEGDNSGGESGSGNQGESGADNTSADDALKTFWDQPKEEPNGAEKSKPAVESNGGQSLGKTIEESISSSAFGEVMSASVMEKLADGDFKGFNDGLNKAMQASVQKSIELNLQVLGEFGTALLTKVEGLIGSKMNSKEDADFLVKEIPSAANPMLRPIVDTIYGQALKINGGDRVKAIATTKQMMKTMSQTTSGDLDLAIVDRDEADDLPARGKEMDWIQELMAKPSR